MSNSIKRCEESNIISNQEIMANILKDNLEDMTMFNENTQFQITEKFDRIGERTYKLYNLESEIDGIGNEQMIFFDDTNGVLDSDYTQVLKMFSVNSLVDVEYSWDKSFKALLILKDGTICIECL